MYKLSELKVAEGSVHKHFRRGQGIGTGMVSKLAVDVRVNVLVPEVESALDLPVVTFLCSVSSLSVDSTLLTA